MRYLLHAALVFALSACFSAPRFNEDKWRRETKSPDVSLLYGPHYRDGRYYNPWMPIEHGGFLRFLRWRLSPSDGYAPDEEQYRPKVLKDLRSRIQSIPDDDFIAWIGHGTFLIRLGGKYWLIDPILSERALLPKRKTPPALSMDEVRQWNGELNVIVTHNHYDHLDKATIQALPQSSRVYVPLGLKETIRDLGKENVTEMDWWQVMDMGEGAQLVCLPAQHWSMRFGQWRNRTLWASFLLITPQAKVYIGGDSGYFIGYQEIGRRFPSIDYALLPLTAYHPRWFMHYAHMNAEEVLDAFHDLGARFLIPTQWGTFRLGNEPIGYPALDLKNEMRKRGVDPSHVIITDIGQVVLIQNESMKGSL